MNKASNQKELKVAIMKNKMDLLAILEHKVTAQNEKKIIQKIVHGWKWISKYIINNKGRIWLVWDPRVVEFILIEMVAQYIHGQVRIFELKLDFTFTVICGLHTV